MLELSVVLLAGWGALAAMLAYGVRDITIRHEVGAVVVATAWFGLCLAVLG